MATIGRWNGDGQKVERHGRRTNVGRKAEATDQFRPPRCGLCVMKLCAPGPSSASSSCQTLPDGVSPNTEGGQTADGRWNRPTNFGHLIGDLLDRGLRRRDRGGSHQSRLGADSGPLCMQAQLPLRCSVRDAGGSRRD